MTSPSVASQTNRKLLPQQLLTMIQLIPTIANNHKQSQPEQIKTDPTSRTENWENSHSKQARADRDSSLTTTYAIGKTQYKPMGGSGWLNKYTSWKDTKYGLVEYPRISDLERSPHIPEHWYWRYCWYEQSQGKPLYKDGKAIVKSIGCPSQKVGAVKQAISTRLPHRQIVEIIKGEDSPPPPT